MPTHPYVTEEMRRQFRQDGVVHLPQVLEPTWMDLAELGMKRNLHNPGPFFSRNFEGTPREFIDDYCNYFAVPEYQMLLAHSPIAEIVSTILGSENLWLYFDQIFVKEAPESEARRTPWHQDVTYWITAGSQLAGFWITFDDTPAEESLEFVRGSHLGTHFAGAGFDADDESATYAPNDPRERLPDIEADRASFDIVSFEIKRGDVVMFHPAMLHGGGGTVASRARRTLSIRFFGDDVTYRVPPRPAPPYPGTAALIKEGEPLRGPWFPQVYPRQSTGWDFRS